MTFETQSIRDDRNWFRTLREPLTGRHSFLLAVSFYSSPVLTDTEFGPSAKRD